MMLFNLCSPLEQFEIYSIIGFNTKNFVLSFTNSSFFIFFFCSFFVFFFVITVFFFKTLVPTKAQIIVESFYIFVLNIVKDNMQIKGESFFPFIFSLFIFVLLANLVGLVPYSFTVTSHLIITFALSILVWLGKLVVGFKKHGIKIFGTLLPSGVPFIIIPFFIIVESVSFCIPLAALGIRLFANIIAGHILLKVIVGFCWSILIASNAFFILHFLPIFVLFLLLFLETAVAFIQAYVFAMLACLITGDIVRGSHLFF